MDKFQAVFWRIYEYTIILQCSGMTIQPMRRIFGVNGFTTNGLPEDFPVHSWKRNSPSWTVGVCVRVFFEKKHGILRTYCVIYIAIN